MHPVSISVHGRERKMAMSKYADFDSGLKISLSPPGILQIQLDSPDGATLTEGMNEGLTEIWRVADRDEDVRCILVAEANGDSLAAQVASMSSRLLLTMRIASR